MITLGIDIGSSSIKIALFDAEKGLGIANASYPSQEMEIISPQNDWAEQNPEVWMHNLYQAMDILKSQKPGVLKQVQAIGISYQMHGLVLLNKDFKLIRNSIIWCDSRAVEIGQKAFNDLGEDFCLGHLLNSPGNFTASKLKWVKDNEPESFKKVHKAMLPGDYVAFRLTNHITTTASGLSEGIFWDYDLNNISEDILNYYGFNKDILPDVVDTFSIQGKLTSEMADRLGLSTGIPVSYRAGDQPNNALSLRVLHPGEVAATAGTSGVVYGISEQKRFDARSRVNTFLHVNHLPQQSRMGILLCLNSVGILNSWARYQLVGPEISYEAINFLGSEAREGSEGLLILPFGNGAERVLENKNIGASIHNLNLTRHHKKHVLRALQESIAFAFHYGLKVMEPMGLNLSVIRAGKSNMFLSPLFTQTLSNLSGARIELYNTNGAEGAARGAAIGSGFFASPDEAFHGFKILETIHPDPKSNISEFYSNWEQLLNNRLK